jgi:AraC-like DNA-binding protein
MSELRRLRGRFPEVAIVIYADFHGRELDLYDLGRMGVDGVILSREEDSHRRIRGAVDRALSTSLAKRVTAKLEHAVPGLGLRCIEWSVERAGECPQVSDLARQIRTSPRALTRELRGMGLPSPRHLLLWGRLLQAARMLDAIGTTVEDVAFQLGYATGASLGRALKEQTGFSPTELQEAGGLDAVLDTFVGSVLDGVQDEEDRGRWSTARVRREGLGSFLEGS